MTDPGAEVVLPAPCVVVLVGASGSGKSTWARTHFRTEQVVSSDALRAVVGQGEDDLAASDDAFSLLDQIVEHRVRRRLTTVIDTLGLDPRRRAAWRELAQTHDVATVCVAFAATAAECRARNRAAGKRVPDRVLSGQVAQFGDQHVGLAGEGWDLLLEPAPVRTAPRKVARTAALAQAQAATPVGLRFGLQVPVFAWPDGARGLRAGLRTLAADAEAAGFSGIWVMDHFRQLPMFGPAWTDMLESYTTLAYLAAVTETVRLGTLVTDITARNVGHLGKIVATLDVLSGGRAMCGLGTGWHEEEHLAYGWPFPPLAERYALLEDALQALPLLWGKGAPSFDGQLLHMPELLGYPRPLQERVPILVGGNGERRTLRLAARYADACNVIGDAELVARKVEVLRAHCAEAGRDPAAVEVTQLSTTLVGRDAAELDDLVDRLRPRRMSAERYGATVNAGTVADQVGRFRALADAGVQTAILRLPDVAEPGAVERFGAVIAAFAGGA
jgi:F420-dependent oxidoreductase-like protein